MNGPEILIPIIAVGGFFSAVITWVYMHYSSRHRERMALIETGKDASIFQKPKREGKNALKLGIVGVMSGIGLFLGSILDRLHIVQAEAGYFSMILLFGGLGLVGFYVLSNAKHPQEKDSDML